MADQVASRQENDIKELFALFDVDGSGTISAHELEAAMTCMGKYPTDADRKEVEDGNGIITQTNFLKMMKNKLNEEEDEEEKYDAFKVFDKDGYGILSADELRKAMMYHGGNLTKEEADDMLTKADIDKEYGQVDYKDLVQLISER